MTRSRTWCFTLNNPDGSLEFPDSVRYCKWQLESGDNGTPHYQGYVEFSQPMRLAALKKWLPRAHFEPRKGSRDQAREYCSKLDTRVEGPFEYGTWETAQGTRTDLQVACDVLCTDGLDALITDYPFVYVKYHSGFDKLARKLKKPRRDDDFVPRPWQSRLLLCLTVKSDDRTIHWVYDSIGNRGKSRLATHLVCEYGAIELDGKLADMSYMYDSQPIVVIDVARSQSDNINHLCTFAEKLKNGRLVSSKYESCMKVFDPPHVVFFSNSMPPEDVWSKDRLKLWDLNCPDYHVKK